MMIWFNIHIPKCAGSTFVEILKKNFNEKFGDGRSYLSDRSFKYNSFHLTEILTHFPYLKCFSDHKLCVDIPFDNILEPIKAIAFIRDPVERLLSHYFYTRGENLTNFDPSSKKYTLEDYVQKCLIEEQRFDLKNGQTYHLLGKKNVSISDIKEIKSLIDSGYLLLFNVSRFKEACIILENEYGDFKDCSFVVKNKSYRNQKISMDLQNRIRVNMNLDYELLHLSNDFTDKCLIKLQNRSEDFQKVMNSFNSRCKKLEKSHNRKRSYKKFSDLLFNR